MSWKRQTGNTARKRDLISHTGFYYWFFFLKKNTEQREIECMIVSSRDPAPRAEIDKRQNMKKLGNFLECECEFLYTDTEEPWIQNDYGVLHM